MPNELDRQDYLTESDREDDGLEQDLSEHQLSMLEDVVVYTTDWTTSTIISELKDSVFDLDPEYQRRDAWTKKHKSRFIESLFMGIPVPPIVLAEKGKGSGLFVVIDGKQRLLTLRQFAAAADDPTYKQLRLTGLEILTGMNGKTLKEISADPELMGKVRAFNSRPIRTIIIRNAPEDILYVIFHRLNTGSVKLSPQELRQALHPGAFSRYADEFSSENETIRKIFKQSDPDFRMRDVELVIRFFGYHFFLDKYHGNMKSFLDYTCQQLNKDWKKSEADCIEAGQRLAGAVDTTFKIFGDKAFRRWSGEDYERTFNRAVFDCMTFYFSDPGTAERALVQEEQVQAAWKDLCSNSVDFAAALQTTTKSIGATLTRLDEWGKVLSRVLKSPLGGVKAMNRPDGTTEIQRATIES